MFLARFTEDADIKRDQSEDELLNAHYKFVLIQNNISGHHHFIIRRNYVNIYIYILQNTDKYQYLSPTGMFSYIHVDIITKCIPHITSG